MSAQALCSVIIGRDEELAILEEALFAAARGDGRVVAISGDAGLGKTRLAKELTARARPLGAAVLSGGCTEADIGLPYLPFTEAIGNWLAGLDIDEARERLGPAAASLAQLFPQLGEAPPETSDPAQARLHLYEGILAALRAAGSGRGVLVIVEDIHWADASTRELLDYMTRRLRGSPAMVLVTFRADELHRKHPLLPIVQGWRRSRSAEFVELSPLPADDVARVIGAIFDEEVSDEFRDLMFDRTEGNPFAIEEMLKEAVDRGDIYRTATGWDRKALPELRIPRSVSEGILLRVGRLDEDHADVLRVASVLGQSFSYETLVAVTGMDETVVLDALEVCVRQQLLDEDPHVRGRYRFRHALTRESVYEDIISPRRRQLHGRAADVLRGDHGSPAELAYHLTEAGRADEAVPAYLAAAEQAFARLGTREAAEFYERALPYVADPRQRGTILRNVGEAYTFETNVGPAEKYLRDAVETLQAAGDVGAAAASRIALGRVFWVKNDPKQAMVEYERARSDLEPLGASRDLAILYIRLAGMHVFDYEFNAARDMSERAIAAAEATGSDRERVWAYGFLGLSLTYGGSPDDGRRWFDRSIDESIAGGFYDVASNTIHNAATSTMEIGRAREGLRVLERFKEIPQHQWGEFAIGFLTGLACHLLGRFKEAERSLVESQRAADETGQSGVWGMWTRAWLSRVYTEQGRLDEAASVHPPTREIEAQEAKQGAESRLRLALARGDIEAAVAHARDLAAFLNAPGAGRSLATVVEAFVAAGRLAEAKEALAQTNVDETAAEYPFVLMAQGRVSLAESHFPLAAEMLSRAREGFAAMGYVPDEIRTKALLAEALHETGSSEDAARELDEAIHAAHAAGAVILERTVRSTADRLGVMLPELHETPRPGTRADEQAAERLVTVLFADVRGYTAMTNREAPADMAQQMTTFYRWARREIEREGGLIDAYAGDAVMASFNVTRPDMDHCVSALRAAVAMQDKSSIQGLPLGVGIAVGPAVVGRLTGSEDVNVIGRTTNLAARLQAHAEDGEVVLDEEAYRRTRGWLDKRGIAAAEKQLTLKGFEGETRIFVVRPGGGKAG